MRSVQLTGKDVIQRYQSKMEGLCVVKQVMCGVFVMISAFHLMSNNHIY